MLVLSTPRLPYLARSFLPARTCRSSKCRQITRAIQVPSQAVPPRLQCGSLGNPCCGSQVGEKLPADITLTYHDSNEQMKEITVGELTAGKKVSRSCLSVKQRTTTPHLGSPHSARFLSQVVLLAVPGGSCDTCALPSLQPTIYAD